MKPDNIRAVQLFNPDSAVGHILTEERVMTFNLFPIAVRYAVKVQAFILMLRPAFRASRQITA